MPDELWERIKPLQQPSRSLRTEAVASQTPTLLYPSIALLGCLSALFVVAGSVIPWVRYDGYYILEEGLRTYIYVGNLRGTLLLGEHWVSLLPFVLACLTLIFVALQYQGSVYQPKTLRPLGFVLASSSLAAILWPLISLITFADISRPEALELAQRFSPLLTDSIANDPLRGGEGLYLTLVGGIGMLLTFLLLGRQIQDVK